MTRKPELKSLRDLTDKDRIAVPSIKTSTQALFLWTAAEKEFGEGQWGKLDFMTVSLPHPDAMAAVLNPSGEITVHAATSPYADLERKAGLHAITDLYAVEGGAVTGLNLVSTEQFRKANPITYDAVVEADGQPTTGSGVAAASILTNNITATLDGGTSKLNN